MRSSDGTYTAGDRRVLQALPTEGLLVRKGAKGRRRGLREDKVRRKVGGTGKS
jgi:hypothetical protein